MIMPLLPALTRLGRPVVILSAHWQRLRDSFAAGGPGQRALQAAVWAAVAFTVLELAFCAWVHNCFAGRYDGPLLISDYFGVPAAEAAAGIRPVCHAPEVGWDGQFYYHIANDPFALSGTPDHATGGIYRYQRIGVPLLAKAISVLCGEKIVSPFLYLTLHIALVCVGFGVLVWWLLSQNLPRWYALGWLLSGGILFATPNGLPDGPGDAFFIMTFIALLGRRLVPYALAATALVLTREGYAVFPAAVFGFTLIGRIAWTTPQTWQRWVLTALPGVAAVGWQAYVCWRLGATPQAVQGAGPALAKLPFAAFWECEVRDFRLGYHVEVYHRLVTALTMLVIGGLTVRQSLRSVAFACLIPYILLVATLGTVIWESIAGFLKCNGTILLIGVFLRPHGRGPLIPFLLAANLLIGMEVTIGDKIVHPHRRHPDLVAQAPPPQPDSQRPADNLTDIRSSVRWLDASPILSPAWNYHGFWRAVHREPATFRLAVQNLSSQTWPAHPAGGPGAILVAYDLVDAHGVRQDGRLVLPRDLGPGDSCELKWVMDLGPGDYTLRVGVLQEDWLRFDYVQPEYGGRYEFRLKP
jgi:hypothetical protein